ncbi:GTP cyclohydrolase, partial [Streptococcus pneumoniae]
NLPTSIDFDFNHPFDPLYPPRVLVVDMDGRETILLPEENDLF